MTTAQHKVMQREFAEMMRQEEAHAEFISVVPRPQTKRDIEYAEYLALHEEDSDE